MLYESLLISPFVPTGNKVNMERDQPMYPHIINTIQPMYPHIINTINIDHILHTYLG